MTKLTKKKALKLSIELWQELSEQSPMDKSSTYNKIHDKYSLDTEKGGSLCFLCDKYYLYYNPEGYSPEDQCRKCILFKSGNDCNRQGSTYDQWDETPSKENTINMLNVLIELDK